MIHILRASSTTSITAGAGHALLCRTRQTRKQTGSRQRTNLRKRGVEGRGEGLGGRARTSSRGRRGRGRTCGRCSRGARRRAIARASAPPPRGHRSWAPTSTPPPPPPHRRSPAAPAPPSPAFLLPPLLLLLMYCRANPQAHDTHAPNQTRLSTKETSQDPRH